MHTAGEAKSLIVPSCAEGPAGDLARAARGAVIQRARRSARESGPPAAGRAVPESAPRPRSVLAGRLARSRARTCGVAAVSATSWPSALSPWLQALVLSAL